ncbi:class I SAM-dependent methyltransferase [Candidatus Pelagibacter sp. Uisw_127]|uniref:class I SAM-dependent methyltransferase n=1 Tax=Candidatus Pelagibacter sp. Uisw_127 TaxID=3230988 RepID=UPI0039ECD47D
MKRLSFRDPLSAVFDENDKIIRKLNSSNALFYSELFEKEFFKKMIESKLIQNSLIDKKNNQITMCHKKLENFTEVTEMSSYQLFLAGKLTLDIAIECLKNGFMLKDASSWNIVFHHGKPIFLDIGSFEKWNGENTWIAYGQFIRHFITPLILNKELGISTSKLFITERDGIYPADAKKKLGIKIFKSTLYLEFVLTPSFFKSSKLNNHKKKSSNVELNQKILLIILKRLKKKLLTLEPLSSSFWTNYTNKRDHYSNQDIIIKKNIIEDFFQSHKGKVLDVGCNTGEFLFLAARYSDETYGIDIDENCINLIQKKLRNENITLSNVNISNPTPSIGWDNKETYGYIKKNINYYDTVIFFGIIHHLITIDRIPLIDIIDLLAKLTKTHLIFEFVSNKDDKFLELASSNIDLYNNFTKENFENIIKKTFNIVEIYNLDYNKNRHVYILKKI